MKIKRILALVLAAACLAGCGAKKDEKIAEDGELTMHMHFFGYCVYDEDWPIFKKAAEITGVKIKGTASETVAESSQAWATMLATKPLPDIVHGERGQLDEFTNMGGFIPLNDLIDKYAPHVKKFFDDCPEARVMASSSDGEIYWIPGSLSGIERPVTPSKGWFIRTDWLKKLGLQAPTTVDELHEVLTAFKTKDPNGNGQADEIPYFARQEGIMDLYQLFGANYNWHEDENGVLIHGKTEESYKNAVREIAKWYKEGLIDPEIYTRGQKSREQLLSNNTGGMTHDWFSSTSKFYDTYKDTIPGFEWDVMLPPADINGVVKETSARSVLHSCGWGISRDCKNPELAIKYFDFWFTDEGSLLQNYGVEGVHYTMVDGKPQYTEEVLNSPDGVPAYMRNQGHVEIGSIGTIESELAGMNEIGRKGYEMYDEGGFVQKLFRAPKFTEEEEELRTEKWDNISSYISEMEQKWILGVQDVDADWDAYIKRLDEMGMKEVTEIYNTAWKRQNEMLKKAK